MSYQLLQKADINAASSTGLQKKINRKGGLQHWRGKIQLVDIKCATFRKHKKGKSLKDKPKGSYRISRSPTKEQKRLNIKLKMFHYD